MTKNQLRVLTGSKSGSLIPLAEGKFLIGREHDCHLRPNSDLISRHHCVFTVDEFTVRLRDLGSTNGTLVNDERIRGAVVLKAGDRVTVGKIDFQVVIDGLPISASDDTIVRNQEETQLGLSPKEPVPATGETLADANLMAVLESPPEAEGDTKFETPVMQPVEAAVPQAAPSFEMQPAAYGAPPMGYPPGYPPPGYPPQYPYGYGQPYPPPMPPGYPPPGYGYPMAPQGMPFQGMPVPAAPPAPEPAAKVVRELDVKLPDPSETGAKAPEPPAPKPVADGTAAPKKDAHIPSAAKDIIDKLMTRRPKTE